MTAGVRMNGVTESPDEPPHDATRLTASIRELLGVAGIVLAALAYAFFQQGGGLLHPEAAFRIPVYLAPGSLLRKIFDRVSRGA